MFYFALYALAAKKLGPSRLRGAIRVAAYASVVSLSLGAIGVHKARAEVGERGLRLGEDMASLASVIQDAHDFTLNGQRIHAGTAVTLEGMDTVLDKFESSCKSDGGPDMAVWESIPDTTKERPKDMKPLSSLPIIRHEEGHKGMVVCIAPEKGSAPHSARALDAMLKQFQETGDLGAIGRLRYAYVVERPTGCQVFTVWTDGSFNMMAMAPKGDLDTPGNDPVLLKRPSGKTQRLFTGTVDGIPYHLFGYKSKETPADTIKEYDKQMMDAGWFAMMNPIWEGAPRSGQEAHAYSRDGRIGMVSAIDSGDGFTLIGIVEVTDAIHTPIEQPKDADGF